MYVFNTTSYGQRDREAVSCKIILNCITEQYMLQSGNDSIGRVEKSGKGNLVEKLWLSVDVIT